MPPPAPPVVAPPPPPAPTTDTIDFDRGSARITTATELTDTTNRGKAVIVVTFNP